jgi:8-amino-7-oxononanoate synthase
MDEAALIARLEHLEKCPAASPVIRSEAKCSLFNSAHHNRGGTVQRGERVANRRNTAFVLHASSDHIRSATLAGLMHSTLKARQGKKVVLPDGKLVTEFINCSYLDLDLHPLVVSRAKALLDDWGVNFCCARSRFSIGPNASLEQGLSQLFRGSAITFPSLTSTHISVMPLIASGILLPGHADGQKVRLVFDRHAHSSMQFLRPILATEANVVVIEHNDLDALGQEARRASATGETPVYVADSVYSMGGLCPVKELLALADSLGIYLYLDDAHGTSIYGDHGEGWVLSQIDGPIPPNLFLAFSLAKGFGANGGGIVVPSESQASLIRRHGQSYAFSSALDFSSIGAALASLSLHGDGTVASLQQTLRAKVALFDQEMGQTLPFSPVRMVHAIMDPENWTTG